MGAALSPDGKLIAVIDVEVSIVDVATNQVMRKIKSAPRPGAWSSGRLP